MQSTIQKHGKAEIIGTQICENREDLKEICKVYAMCNIIPYGSTKFNLEDIKAHPSSPSDPHTSYTH